MSKIRVGVLRGGPSEEYDVSLMSGQNVLDHLGEHYEVSDILITKDGQWNIGGLLSSPVRAMRRVDVFFNALHGAYGEDGKLQQLLDHHAFRYTGSGKLASALAMNKILAKKYFHQAGLLTPRSVYFRNTFEANNYESQEHRARKRASSVVARFAGPWIVKPIYGGSSVGIHIAKNMDELTFAIQQNQENQIPFFIEEMIFGKEVTCGILDKYDKNRHHALPPIEIISEGNAGFFDYDSKYSGKSKEVPYGSLEEREVDAVQKVAATAHRCLGLRHYSRSDMLLTPRGKVYILEANALPGLSEKSLLPKALEEDEVTFPDFLDRIIGQTTGHL